MVGYGTEERLFLIIALQTKREAPDWPAGIGPQSPLASLKPRKLHSGSCGVAGKYRAASFIYEFSQDIFAISHDFSKFRKSFGQKDLASLENYRRLTR